ncbi:MAG: DUF4160 domain-containing protein [Opitutaceae bacterium]|nr:DUF4160 domain-containing protein [Verrucomicrobiales bacterium]
MPVLSKFYGIVIRMFFTKSFTPHFHAFYQGHELMVGIDDVDVIQGHAPGRVRDMVLEWAWSHQAELREAWRRCENSIPPRAIQPLE